MAVLSFDGVDDAGAGVDNAGVGDKVGAGVDHAGVGDEAGYVADDTAGSDAGVDDGVEDGDGVVRCCTGDARWCLVAVLL